MKKTLKLTLAMAALLMMGGAMTTVSAQKLGRLNSNELIQAMPEIKNVEASLRQIYNEHARVFEEMQVEFNKKLEEANQNGSTWTDAVRNMRQQELSSLAERLETYQRSAQEDLDENEQKLMAPIIEKARAAVDAVSKANGFTAVFDVTAGALVYFDEATVIDILPLVKRHLGI